MISKLMRERLTYVAMSAFLAWHTAAMLIGPAPDNGVIAIAVRPLFQPYLSLLRLDNVWDFFAPTVDLGRELHYTVEDAAGNRQTFIPSQELSWFHPNAYWARSWDYLIMDDTDTYAEEGAAFYCRKHSALHPVAITFSKYDQSYFSADDYLDGKLPTDPEFLTETVLARVPCPGS